MLKVGDLFYTYDKTEYYEKVLYGKVVGVNRYAIDMVLYLINNTIISVDYYGENHVIDEDQNKINKAKFIGSTLFDENRYIKREDEEEAPELGRMTDYIDSLGRIFVPEYVRVQALDVDHRLQLLDMSEHDLYHEERFNDVEAVNFAKQINWLNENVYIIKEGECIKLLKKDRRGAYDIQIPNSKYCLVGVKLNKDRTKF